MPRHGETRLDPMGDLFRHEVPSALPRSQKGPTESWQGPKVRARKPVTKTVSILLLFMKGETPLEERLPMPTACLARGTFDLFSQGMRLNQPLCVLVYLEGTSIEHEKGRSFNERAQRRIAFVNQHFLIRATAMRLSQVHLRTRRGTPNAHPVRRIARRVEPSDGFKASMAAPNRADRIQWQAPREPRKARRSQRVALHMKTNMCEWKGCSTGVAEKAFRNSKTPHGQSFEAEGNSLLVPRQDPCSCDVAPTALARQRLSTVFGKADGHEWRFRGAGLRR